MRLKSTIRPIAEERAKVIESGRTDNEHRSRRDELDGDAHREVEQRGHQIAPARAARTLAPARALGLPLLLALAVRPTAAELAEALVAELRPALALLVVLYRTNTSMSL